MDQHGQHGHGVTLDKHILQHCHNIANDPFDPSSPLLLPNFPLSYLLERLLELCNVRRVIRLERIPPLTRPTSRRVHVAQCLDLGQLLVHLLAQLLVQDLTLRALLHRHLCAVSVLVQGINRVQGCGRAVGYIGKKAKMTYLDGVAVDDVVAQVVQHLRLNRLILGKRKKCETICENWPRGGRTMVL